MKKYEVLYDWPIAQIAILCDSAETEAFVGSLGQGSASEAELLTCIDGLRAFGSDLVTAKTDKRLYAQWGDIRKLLDEIEQKFPAFPNLNPDRFEVTLLLAEKLAVSLPPPLPGPAGSAPAPDIDEAEINEHLFELRAPCEPLPIAWFVHQNAQSFPDSVVIFTSTNMTALAEAVTKSTDSPDILFHLLGTLHVAAQIPIPQAVLVKRSTPGIDAEAVEGFAKLLLLASGKPVHSPRNYSTPPHIIDIDCIRAGTPYQQLTDVFYVMSEYNSRPDLLAKYLSIYHVVENFMFKLPIVKLERARNGEMFSIRDFKRLYEELDIREMNALKKLMTVVFDFEPLPSTKFITLVSNRWLAFCPSADIPKIDALLERLGIRRGDNSLKHAEFCGDNASLYFAQIVYAVRNVIVHNTETEWHLSYATLDTTTRLLLEGFLLPSLEEICFALVGSSNKHVWYQNKVLSLY
jgi:hypothetical protein